MGIFIDAENGKLLYNVSCCDCEKHQRSRIIRSEPTTDEKHSSSQMKILSLPVSTATFASNKGHGFQQDLGDLHVKCYRWREAWEPIGTCVQFYCRPKTAKTPDLSV